MIQFVGHALEYQVNTEFSVCCADDQYLVLHLLLKMQFLFVRALKCYIALTSNGGRTRPPSFAAEEQPMGCRHNAMVPVSMPYVVCLVVSRVVGVGVGGVGGGGVVGVVFPR